MGKSSIIAALALLATAVAGPLESRSGPCARQCTESAKFAYTPGTSYTFDYESDAVTTMQGTSQEESRLHLKTRVEIHAISKCDFIMRLSGVTLENSDPTNARSRRPVGEQEVFKQSLERFTLRFSFQDGRVDSVCPAEGETPQALNIKRGILSVIQTSAGSLETAEKVVETDVAGKCTVNYEPLGRGWNSVTVRKTKDLTSCSDRHNAETAIQINPFTENEATKSMPLIKGSQDCQQIFKHNRLESVMCTETHVFRPFSRQDGGAMTKVTQALTFNNEKKTAFTGADYASLQKAMTYDHENQDETRDRRTRQVEMTLVDLCMAAKDDIRPSVPGKFTTFVYGLRHLDHTDLVNMYRRVERICPDNQKAKKMYLDGVTMAGTSGAIKFIVDLMQRGEMVQSEVDLWMSTLAFVNKPDKDTIAALTPLLEGNRMGALLPVSAVVHTYCRHNPECGVQNEVRQAVRKITAILGNSCNGDKTKVMLALKALGNMGVSYDAEDKLQSCFQNKALDTEVRVAAIQAYRRFSCDVMRSPVIDLYTTTEENVEVRIAAFLSAMRCPSRAHIFKVKETMEVEKLKQVGSFVMSYLKNIEQKTAFKSEVHDILSNVEYLNKFESDIRKFSRNYRSSLFFDSLDSGVSVDSNIIFDPSSYLPKTAMLNLTVDMMGNSVNLFELEGRTEGLERLVERMFGPEGYFRKQKPMTSARPKKSIFDNKIEDMSQKFDVEKRFEKEPSLSLDVKVFGNSLWYKKVQQGNMASEAFNAMDIMVELAKEQEVEFTKSFLFLDTVVTIPTGSGLPLRLAINGSAVMNLKMSGKVDAKSLQNVDVHGKIQPSGAVEVATLMTVDAGVAKTGLKMVATLHSSTLLDGLVEVRNGKVYHARLNVPRDQIEIIDVQSRIFLVHGAEEREQKTENEAGALFTECTGRFTQKPLGMEMCGSLQLPAVGRKNAPLYPFSGPANFRLFFRKTDPTLTHYNAEMRWTEDKNGRDVSGLHLVMSFNTPQSKNDREVSAEFHLNKIEGTVLMKVKVPNKKFALTGKSVMNENEKRLSLGVSVDDVEKFSVSTAMVSDEIDGGFRYQPTFEVRGPSSRLINVRGAASMKHLKYSGEIVVEDLTEKPVVLNGEMSIGERDRYEGNVNIESYVLTAKVKGHAQFRSGFSSKMNILYRVMEGRQEKLDVTSKIRDLSANGLSKYTGAASMVSTALPEYTTALSWETQFTTGHVENSLEFSFGDGRIRRIQKINLQEIVRYEGELENNKVEAVFRMTYPEKDIDFAFTMNHQNTLQALNNKVSLKYAPGKEATSSVDAKVTYNPLKVTSDVQVKYPGREMKLQANVNQMKPREFETSIAAQWQRGKQVRAVGVFRDRSTRDGKDYQANLEMTMPNTRPMSVSTQLTTITGRYVISADGDFGRGGYGLKGEYTTTSLWNHRVSTLVKTPKNSYNAEATLQKNREQISGKIDINVPEVRRVTGSIEMNNGAKVKTAMVDAMWNADKDQSQRLTVDGEFRQNADGHEGKFNYKAPSKTLSGSYNANYNGQYNSGLMRGNLHAELEWENSQKVSMDLGGNFALKASRRQVNGDIKINTPFSGIENLAFTVQHTDTWPEWNNKMTVQWKKNRKMIIGTEGKFRSDAYSSFLDTSMRINTPFRNYESLSIREVFEQRPSEMSSSSFIQWGAGKAIDFSLSGAFVGSNGIRAGVNFTSPFNTLRDLSASLSNSYSRNTIDSDIDLRWNGRNTLSMNFDGRYAYSGKKHTCSADVQLLSTIQNYEKLTTKIIYNNDGRDASVNSDMRWNNQKITVGMNGVNKNTYYGYDMQGKMEYSTSFKGFESGEVKISHVNDAQKFTSNVESRLPYNHNMNVKVQGNMPSIREMDSSLELSSTLIEDITYVVAYKMEGNRFVANGLATYGSQKISGDIIGSVNYGSRAWDVDYKVNINTPFKGLEEMKLTVTQNRRELQFTTRVQASKNGNTISFNHDIKIEDMLNFVNNMKITTPFRNMRTVELNINQDGKSGEYKHSSELQWGNKKSFLTMELNNRNTRRGRSLEARLNAKSPFPQLSSLDVEMKHEDDQRSYKPRFSVQWNDVNKFGFDGVINNDRYQKVDVNLAATSSFNGYETIMFNSKYDVSQKQKTADMTYRWNARTNQAVTFKGIFEADVKNGMIDLTVTCPLRGLETMQVKADYTITGTENTVNLFTVYGVNQYTITGKHVMNNNGQEMNVQVSTPITGYEKLASFVSYTINKHDMSTEASYEWGSNQKVMATADYRSRNGKMVSKINVNTPFEGYRKQALKVESDMLSPRKTVSVLVQWDPSQVIQTDLAFESDFSRFGNMNVVFRSPFNGFKEITANGQVKALSGEYTADGTVQWMPMKKVTGAIMVKPNEVMITFDTPIRPYRNVRLSGMLNAQELVGSLEWENTNKADFIANFKTSDNMIEGKVELNAPFNGMQTYSASGSIMNDNYKRMEGRGVVVTPFKGAEKFQAGLLIQNKRDAHEISLTFDGPASKTSVNGNVRNNNFRDMDGSLKVESNTQVIPNFSVKSSFKNDNWKSVEATAELNNGKRHTISGSFKNEDESYRVQATVETPYLPVTGERMTVSANANINDMKNMEGSVSVELPSQRHVLAMTEKYTKRGFETEIKVNSPAVAGNEMTMNVFYSNKKSKNIQGKISMNMNRESHVAEFNFNNENRETIGTLNIQCSLIPSGKLNLEGKVSRPTENELESTFALVTGITRHSLVVNGKLLEKKMDLNVNLDSPAVSPSVVSLTASFNNEFEKNVEGAVSFKTAASESRMAFNMKRNGWRDVDAFFTLNLPIETLSMVRVDLKMKNDGLKSMEGSLDIQTSLKSMKRMVMSGKMKNTDSAWDMSVNFKLPVRDLDNISLLATIHKNPTMSRVSPRITLSLPNKQYVVYATYEKNGNDVQANLGSEWDNKKTEISIGMRAGEYHVTLLTPVRGYERHSVVAIFGNEKGRRTGQVVFEDAANQKYTVDGALNFNNVLNFNGDVQIKTPLVGLREVSTKLRQQYRRGRWIMSLEHSMDRYNKVSVTVDHNSNPTVTGTIQVITPMENLKNMKVTYNWQSAQNVMGKMDMELNSRNVFRMEYEKAYQSDTRSYSNNAVVELPTFPYTLTVTSKPLPAGSEITVKSVLPSRSMNFQTMYQSSSSHFSHGAQISLDERSGKTLSYEIRSTDTSRQGNELYGRLNLPIRSFELRTTHQKTSTGRTLSGDLFWDAARDPTRHMKVTLEHADNSNRQNIAHKIRLSASHPQLSKDIVCSAECLLSGSEIYAKTEMEYSRFQQHNMFLEMRVRNSAQSRRESRYSASLVARHPVTNLDMSVNAEVANNQQEMTAEVKMNYMDQTRRQQIQELRANIMKVKQHIELMARSNDNKINVLGRMFQRDNELTLALEQTVNNEAPVHSHFRFSQRHSNMELNISSLSGERIHLKASMPEDHLQAEISHTRNMRSIKDADLYIGLKEAKILESRINWRPEMFNEAQESVVRAYDRHVPLLSSAVSSLQNEIGNEFNVKTEMMGRALLQETKPFLTEVTKEMKKVRVDAQRGSNEIFQMYRRDEFYMRSAAESMDGVFQTISNAWSKAVQYMSQSYDIFYETASMTVDILNNMMDEVVEDVIRMVVSWQKSAAMALSRMGDRMSQIREVYLDQMAQKGLLLANMVMSSSGDLVVSAAEKVQEMVSRYAPTAGRYLQVVKTNLKTVNAWILANYADQMKMVTEHPTYLALSEYAGRVMQTVWEFKEQLSYEEIVSSSRMMLQNSGENVAHAYAYIRDHPNINYVNEIAAKAFQQSRQLAMDLGMNTMAVNIAEELFQKTQQLVWNSLRDLVDEYSNFRGNLHYTYEPENGKIEMEMRMPVLRNSLIQLLDVHSYPQIQKLRELTSQISFGDFCVWDTYYKYKRYTDVSYWIPPFKAQAMIVGNQHFMTFDQLDFDFAGECSYLLARDFLDGNFTVTVNYVRDDTRAVKKSLNIYTDGVKVEVSRDNKVTVDDRKVELPQEIGQTAVTMEDGVITVNNRLGYKVKCNFVHDLCTMEVSGFYFGKTGGLFGTNNYEPALDMMTPNNKLAANLEDFSESWKVGTAQCTRKNMAEGQIMDIRAQEKCEALFKNDNSEFRSCFRQVNPKPFLSMCSKDLSLVRESEQMSKMCSSAAAYVENCRHEGVNLNMPKHCVRCQRMNADDMLSGDVVRITNGEPVRAADVVFIVEEKECNRNVPRVLSKLAQSIEGSFRKNGYRQVHFAVVGFGGDGIYSDAHVVTSDSQVFATVRNVDSALNSLPTGNGDSNIFMALRYAAGLPFMTGSTKTFVLAKCSACKVEEMKADYSEMLRTMLDSDITLHLLMDHEFETKSATKAPKAKKVLGLDRKFAYTQKDMKDSELRGDQDLLAQLKTPKDLCVPLALEVNGSFFSMSRLLDSSRNVNKKTVEVFSRRVIKTAEPAECQICECIATQSGIGKSVCQRCVSPVVAQLVSDDISPMIYPSNEGDHHEPSNVIESEEVEDVLEEPARPVRKSMKNKRKN